MTLTMHGQPLTQQHCDLLVPLLNQELGGKKFIRTAEKIFREAGIPIEPLAADDAVSWEHKTVKGKGHVVDYDERADKVRVRSKEGRGFTIPARDVRLLSRADASA